MEMDREVEMEEEVGILGQQEVLANGVNGAQPWLNIRSIKFN